MSVRRGSRFHLYSELRAVCKELDARGPNEKAGDFGQVNAWPRADAEAEFKRFIKKLGAPKPKRLPSKKAMREGLVKLTILLRSSITEATTPDVMSQREAAIVRLNDAVALLDGK